MYKFAPNCSLLPQRLDHVLVSDPSGDLCQASGRRRWVQAYPVRCQFSSNSLPLIRLPHIWLCFASKALVPLWHGYSQVPRDQPCRQSGMALRAAGRGFKVAFPAGFRRTRTGTAPPFSNRPAGRGGERLPSLPRCAEAPHPLPVSTRSPHRPRGRSGPGNP